MNSRVTLLLVALLLVLAAYVYFYELNGSQPEDEAAVGVPLYSTPYREYDVVELEITGLHSMARFRRTDEALDLPWKMVTPQAIPPEQLDQVRVNGAAVRLAKLSASQVITGVNDLAQYGLHSPELTTTLTISNGQKLVFYAGAPAPVGGSRYIRTLENETTVYLVFGFAVDDLFRMVEEPPLMPTAAAPLATVSP